MSLPRALSTPLAAATVLASALLLAACGGGDQKETFQPTRIVAFGDENTLIAPTGRQYSVNNLTPIATTNPNGVPCRNNPIWVQYVASDYGLPFAVCTAEAERPTALMRASVGATVASVQQAIDTLNASAAPLNSNDLVTLMVGTHDLLEIIGTNKTPNAAELETMRQAALARGRQAGALVQQVVARGARILFTTVPNLATAPLAQHLGATNAGYNAAALQTLSVAFNDGLNLGSQVPSGGGRNGAVLQVDSLVNVYRDNPETYTAVTERFKAACMADATTIMADADLVNCTATATVDTAKFAYLWAGRVQFGTFTHGLLGQEAVARIRANPL